MDCRSAVFSIENCSMVKGANLEQLNSCLCRLRQRYPTAIAHELFKRVEAVERQTTGALFDKIEFDRGRSVRCPIRISVRHGEYPPRFRSTRCMMFARRRARRASTSLYPIASYGELSVCIPLSLLQMGRVVYSERVQITFGESNDADFVIVSSLLGEPPISDSDETFRWAI